MKKHILILAFIALVSIGFAQTKNIVVTSGATSTAYSDLPSAITAAPNGATIYIPGGIHTLSSDITITKQLHFKGDGHFTLAVANGLVPQISGSKLIFKRAAHNSTFEGLYFANIVSMVHETTDLTGYFYLTFNRCKFDNNITASGGSATIGSINIFINECVFYGVSLSSSIEAVYITNSIMTGVYSMNSFCQVNQGYIKNSILLDGIYLYASSNISITNSISYSQISTNSLNNTVSHCLLKTSSTINADISSADNLWQDWANIFVNAPTSIFNQGFDYHLKAGCLGINAGSDNTDMGIYGSTTPWKENSIPSSPNVYYKSVSNSNNSQGEINTTYKVKAQTN